MSISSQNGVSGVRPVNAAQSLPKRTDPRETTFGAGVPADLGKPEAAPTKEGHARLEAFSKKLETRFDGALKNENLSARQREALEQERDRFHSLIARFESAYLDGTGASKQDAAEGIKKLVESFSKSVNHIVSGGEIPTPTDGSGSSTGTTNNAGRGRIDLVG